MGNKWHKNCGGKVIYQMPEVKTTFSKAGKCLSCEAFPITEEDIIFEINENEVERLYDEFEKNVKGWRIVRKDVLKERLDK